MAVINGVDDDPVPTDFQYITENVETTNLNINQTISSLQNYHLLPDFNMTEPPLIFECNKGCRCWSTCNNRVVQNGITCRLQLVKTEGRGWGVKTLLDIPKGIFICEFDYGEKFWIIKWKQFTCACNSPKCKYSKDTIQKTLQEYRQRHEEDEPID
uniref:Histone-lysine N-methyltransferase, H3 lysine-9 specific 3 n=1 Tax=Magallana gigas TaxID=29159 RepID=K1Q7C1_MAGGI